jgi:hexosaminidase
MFTSSYFSTGGDEINVVCYQNDTQTQADLKKRGLTFEQALDSFTKVNHAALKKAGKTAVVWEEMVLDHNVTIAKDSLVLCAFTHSLMRCHS